MVLHVVLHDADGWQVAPEQSMNEEHDTAQLDTAQHGWSTSVQAVHADA